jgi:hypothetical protein
VDIVRKANESIWERRRVERETRENVREKGTEGKRNDASP